MPSYAAAHPGKIGDCLYCLPTLRKIYRDTGKRFDFYTSQYCARLKELFEYQDCIEKFYISDSYILKDFGCGAQPWYVPLPDNLYEKVYQFGFRRTPDQMLHQWIWREEFTYDVPLAIEYDFPKNGRVCGRPYVTIAPRGQTSFSGVFIELVSALLEKEIGVAVVGGPGENIFPDAMDFTGESFLNTLSIMSYSEAFIGLQSSQLVLANGLPIPRIAMNDGKSWDMRHVIKYHLNYYPINPTTEDILEIIRKHRADNFMHSNY